jgi:hypothetical protein
MYLGNGETFRLTAEHDAPAAWVEQRRSEGVFRPHPDNPGGRSLSGRAASGHAAAEKGYERRRVLVAVAVARVPWRLVSRSNGDTHLRWRHPLAKAHFPPWPCTISGGAVRRRQAPPRLPRLSGIVRPTAPKTASGSSRSLRKRLR